MKNLFEFATKELSQDAFLRWLFENYDCEDEDVRNTARKLLINFLKKENHVESPEDISYVWTKAQDHKADIVVVLKGKSTKEYGIIIEDKTFTGEHNDQLQTYYDTFKKDKWWSEDTKNSTKKELVFIYYKTTLYNKKEINENWHTYDIDDIYKFFNSTGITYTNFLLKQYVDHINKLYNDFHYVSTNKPIEWNFLNWETYFEKEIHSLWNTDNRCAWIGRYHNTYISYCFKLLLKKEVCCHNNYVVLELFFRKNQDKITSTIHPCIDDIVKNDEIYSEWHVRNEHKKEDEAWIDSLRKIVNDSKSKYYKPLVSKQCVSTSRNDNDISLNQDIESIKKEIELRLKDFCNIFESKIVS